MHYLQVGNVTERGCITDETAAVYCSQTNSSCSTCEIGQDGSACNNYTWPKLRRKCLFKALNETSSKSKYCANSTDWCISVNVCGRIARSCQGIFQKEGLDYCRSHKESCTRCNSVNNCNTGVPIIPVECNMGVANQSDLIFCVGLIIFGTILGLKFWIFIDIENIKL